MISKQPFITKLGMSSSLTDLDGLRCLRALQMSSSEIRAFDKKFRGLRNGEEYPCTRGIVD
jgi:hypothetical protein